MGSLNKVNNKFMADKKKKQTNTKETEDDDNF